MPVLINVNGHTPSVRRAIEYLAKDVEKPVLDPNTGAPTRNEDGTPQMRLESRAICDEAGQPILDCRHCALPEDELGRPIWKQMDETRRRAGNDVPYRKGQKVRSHMHFIISPDPRDKVTIDTLRDLARSWVGHHFPDFESVIASNANVEADTRLVLLLAGGLWKLMPDKQHCIVTTPRSKNSNAPLVFLP
jgi:hypothetical protein